MTSALQQTASDHKAPFTGGGASHQSGYQTRALEALRRINSVFLAF
jgi:hypothetical protein